MSRSYLHGPIAGCFRQRSATFAEKSIDVCWRTPLASATHTYCVLGGTTTTVGGAFLLLAIADSSAARGGRGRLTTAASRISSVDVIGTCCFSTDGTVQADDAIATASNGNKRFMFPAGAPAVSMCRLKGWHARGQTRNQRIVMRT